MNPLREDIDGIRSLINIFTHKFDIENLWMGKPLAFVDDILITSSWGFFAYAFFVAYYTSMKVYLDCTVIFTNKRDEQPPTPPVKRSLMQTLNLIFGRDLILMWLPVKARRSHTSF